MSYRGRTRCATRVVGSPTSAGFSIFRISIENEILTDHWLLKNVKMSKINVNNIATARWKLLDKEAKTPYIDMARQIKEVPCVISAKATKWFKDQLTKPNSYRQQYGSKSYVNVSRPLPAFRASIVSDIRHYLSTLRYLEISELLKAKQEPEAIWKSSLTLRLDELYVKMMLKISKKDINKIAALKWNLLDKEAKTPYIDMAHCYQECRIQLPSNPYRREKWVSNEIKAIQMYKVQFLKEMATCPECWPEEGWYCGDHSSSAMGTFGCPGHSCRTYNNPQVGISVS
jgi:hypothetical protein